jgi:hypothetical protein
MITPAIVLAMSLDVPDAKGTKNYRPMPRELAVEIVALCTRTKIAEKCGALLSVLGFRESGYNFSAVHDGGKGCGAFGLLCTFPHATWKEQVESAWSVILKSVTTCKEPLAMYASGSCERGHKVAREYMSIADAIAKRYSIGGT